MHRTIALAAALAAAAATAGCGEASGDTELAPPAATAPAAVAPARTATASGTSATVPAAPAAGNAAPTGGGAPAVVAPPALVEPPPLAHAAGTLRARRTTRVAAQVSGRVEEVLVDAADRVKKGDLLVRLDPALFEIDLRRREAEVAAARAERDDAEIKRGRIRKLWEETEPGAPPTIARSQVDEAEMRAAAAAARLAVAEQSLAWARRELAETRILAPFDGTITARYVDPGAAVTSPPVTELLEIQETSVLYLEFSLPQTLFGAVAPGTRVEYEFEAAPPLRGEAAIATVLPALDEATRSFWCRVVIEGERAARLRPGMLGRVRIPAP